MAKSKYNYIEDNISQNYAPRQYSAPFTTQTLPQLNFAQYAFQDPKFALGMLIGNAVGANILNRKQKEADQMLFRQDNPVSMPDNVPLYDTSTTPTLADGKTAAVGNAYSGFGANPSQVSTDFLSNLQGVNGRLNYNTDTGAVNYQMPTFLPSMYAENNLGKYYPTATDADGNMIGNISFADYLNNQSKAGQGQGLFDFNALQKMAADDAAKAAAKNPQATVAQNMGVLPTANVDVPSKSNSYIPAITGRLGNPINGSLSMSGFNLNSNDPNSKFYTWNLKSGGDVADASPAAIPSAQTTVHGMITPGNVDTTNGLPKAKVVSIDDKHYVLPATAPDGTTLNADQTAYNFYETGNTLGVFSTKKAADKYASKINNAAGDNPTPVGGVHAMTQQPIDKAPIQDVQPIQPVDNQPIKPVDNQPIKEQPAPIQDEQPIKPLNDVYTSQTMTPDQTTTTTTATAPNGTQVTITADKPTTQATDNTQKAPNSADNADNMTKGLFPNDPEKLMDTLFPGETQVDNPAYKDLLDQYNKETDPAKKQALMDKLDNTSKYLLRSPNAEYIAAKQLVDAETDDKKKKEMMVYLNNIAPYNMRPLAPTEGSLRTNLSGGAPPHVDAQKNEADFLHWAIQHNVPMDIVNSELEVYRPQWQAQENEYNQYKAGQVAAKYWNAIDNGEYDKAAIYAQDMQQYNPGIASYFLTNTPGGRDFYTTQVKKDAARDANNYKMQQMSESNKYTLGQIAFRGKIDEHMLKEKQTFTHNENVDERNFKKWVKEGDWTNKKEIAAYNASHRGKGGGSSGGSGNGPSKQEVSNAYRFITYWEKEHQGDSDDSWKSNSDYINAKQVASQSVNPNYDLSEYPDLYRFATDMLMDQANGQNNLTDVEISKALYTANPADAPYVVQQLRKDGYTVPFLNP